MRIMMVMVTMVGLCCRRAFPQKIRTDDTRDQKHISLTVASILFPAAPPAAVAAIAKYSTLKGFTLLERFHTAT